MTTSMKALTEMMDQVYDPLAGRNTTSIIEIGVVLDKTLHIQDDDDVIPHPGVLKTEKGNRELRPHILKEQKKLDKSATFPLSRSVVTSPPGGEEGHSAASLSNDSSLKSGLASCSRALSFPSSRNLVSAMKGGREQNGISAKTKMNVKWAPDVYDPRTTSVSHTVKSGYGQRVHYRSSKKKDKHKHKHKKGSKLTRVYNGGDKKHSPSGQRGVTTADVLQQRMQPLARVPADYFDDAAEMVELVEFSVSGSQESNKCGSFLRASLTKVHCSVAEA